MTEITEEMFRNVYGDGRIFEYKEGEISIWCKDRPMGIVTNAWIHNGQATVWIMQTNEARQFNIVLELCRNLVKNELVTCSGCGGQLKKDEIAGYHFAGRYCKECWPKYQALNSRKCRLCGRPLWDCCC